MNKIQVFENKEFGQLRTLDIGGVRWFVGKDVAVALGYSNASKAIIAHVDNEDKQFKMLDISDSQNGNPVGKQSKTAFINESGLYSLILSSKLPSAKRFKRWVTSEVLPSIRRTGGYLMKAKQPPKSALQQKYEYFPKTYRGEPVMITPDIAHAVGKSIKDISSLIKRSPILVPENDYKLLTGTALREFEKENPKLKPGHSMLYVVYYSGVVKLFGIYRTKPDAPMLPPSEPEFVDPINDKAYMKLVDNIENAMNFLSSLLRHSLKKKSYEDFKKLAVSIKNVGFEIADQAYGFTKWEPERASNTDPRYPTQIQR